MLIPTTSQPSHHYKAGASLCLCRLDHYSNLLISPVASFLALLLSMFNETDGDSVKYKSYCVTPLLKLFFTSRASQTKATVLAMTYKTFCDLASSLLPLLSTHPVQLEWLPCFPLYKPIALTPQILCTVSA